MAYRYGTLSITSNNMVELNETEIASTELFKRKETRIVIIRTESEEVKCKLEFFPVAILCMLRVILRLFIREFKISNSSFYNLFIFKKDCTILPACSIVNLTRFCESVCNNELIAIMPFIGSKFSRAMITRAVTKPIKSTRRRITECR